MYSLYFSSPGRVMLTPQWREQGLPAPLMAFLEKWEAIAKAELAVYQCLWPAKMVHTDFTCGGIRYMICPETFGIPQDLGERLQCGRSIVEKYGTGLDDDLRAVEGVTEVFSEGFLD